MLPDIRFIIGAVLAVTMLGVVSLGLFTNVRLGPQTKSGPLQTSRHLSFDDRPDWNQFYHPEAGRRFEELAGKADAADVAAKHAADEPLEVTHSNAAADEEAAPARAPEPSAEVPPVTAPNLTDQHLPDRAAAPAWLPAEAELPAERAPDQQRAVTQPQAGAAEIEPEAAERVPAGAVAAADAAAEVATAVPLPAPALDAVPALAPGETASVAAPTTSASDTSDEPNEPATRAPAATGSMPLWQDEPLFIVADGSESPSAADRTASAPAIGTGAGNNGTTPPAAAAPAKRITPRPRRLAKPAKQVVRAALPVRARATPPRRRAVAARRTAPRSSSTLDPHFSEESGWPQDYAPHNYAPRPVMPRRPARRQRQPHPFEQSP